LDNFLASLATHFLAFFLFVSLWTDNHTWPYELQQKHLLIKTVNLWFKENLTLLQVCEQWNNYDSLLMESCCRQVSSLEMWTHPQTDRPLLSHLHDEDMFLVACRFGHHWQMCHWLNYLQWNFLYLIKESSFIGLLYYIGLQRSPETPKESWNSKGVLQLVKSYRTFNSLHPLYFNSSSVSEFVVWVSISRSI
jgi:hypothetical protein